MPVEPVGLHRPRPEREIIDPAKLDAPDFLDEEAITISYAEAEAKREGSWAMGEAVKQARAQKSGGLDRDNRQFIPAALKQRRLQFHKSGDLSPLARRKNDESRFSFPAA